MNYKYKNGRLSILLINYKKKSTFKSIEFII